MAGELPDRARLFDLKARRTRKAILPYIRYLWRESPDLVVSYPSSVSIVVALVNGSLTRSRPVLFAQRMTEALLHDKQTRLRYRVQQKLLALAYRRARAIMAVSQGVADQLVLIPGLRPERISVIHNPTWNAAIEARAAEPADHPWLQSGSDIPVVLAVGRLSPEKGMDTLVRAFHLVHQRRRARLIIVGEGSERPALGELISELGLGDAVSTPGFRSNPFSYMARSSVLVLPSRHEGFGNVIVEAMTCGTPVVATNSTGGTAEILENGRYGPLVPVDDPERMAIAIEAMLDRPTAPEILRARARHFSATASADAFEACIRDLMTSHRGR